MILLQCKNGDHKTLAGVYVIPHLTTNIVSLDQLEEAGHWILLFPGFLKVWDRKVTLLAKVERGANMLYMLELNIVQLVCLATHGCSVAWKWHMSFGHLDF
jgi:hypothetical protein